MVTHVIHVPHPIETKLWGASPAFFPRGLVGIGGAMVLVLLSMSDTGVLGLAASHVRKPDHTMGASIRNTKVGVYVLYVDAAVTVTAILRMATVPTWMVDAIHDAHSGVARKSHGIPWMANAISGGTGGGSLFPTQNGLSLRSHRDWNLGINGVGAQIAEASILFAKASQETPISRIQAAMVPYLIMDRSGLDRVRDCDGVFGFP